MQRLESDLLQLRPEEPLPERSPCLKNSGGWRPSPETKAVGEAVIQQQLPKIPNEKARAVVAQHLQEIAQGQRDFRF